MKPVPIPGDKKKGDVSEDAPQLLGTAAIEAAREQQLIEKAAGGEVECTVCFDLVLLSKVRRCANGHLFCDDCLSHLSSLVCTECGTTLRDKRVTPDELEAYGPDAD